MPYLKGTATSLSSLLGQITAWVTDEAIHGTDAWTVKRSDPWPRGTIYEAKGLNGINKSYIGLLPLDIVAGITYKNWIQSSANIGRHLIWNKNALNKQGMAYIHVNGSNTFQIITEGTTNYTSYMLNSPEIAYKSSSAIVFGVFKQYNDGLDWNEQPGSIEFGNLGQYPLNYSLSTGGNPKITPPIYPGVGYPGIGMAYGSTNLFKFWLTKDACRLTVVINNGDHWDVGHAGMLVPYQSRMQYPFPAVVAGSNSGLRTVVTKTTSATTFGTMIDYTSDNNSMSRSLPCVPCVNTSNGTATNSQLMVCLPDGEWQSFTNWTQSLVAASTNYPAYFARPARVSPTAGYQVRPLNTDVTKVSSVLDDTATFATETFDLVQNDATSGSAGMLGHLYNMSWPGLGSTFGEVTLSGKKCVILPNGWEDRLWAVPLVSPAYDSVNATYSEITTYGKQFRMLIRLED